jgi:hypothetical protein
MGTEKKMQPTLIHMAYVTDIEATPIELVKDMIAFFRPAGRCLDPCAGDGRFYDRLPAGADWCEIERGRDFYACTKQVDTIIGNPPYSHYSAWMRHSMKLAKDIIYVMPVYKVFSSGKFQDDLFAWGGIVHIRRYGTGTQWGFPFGFALAAVHYQRGYDGDTSWSRY